MWKWNVRPLQAGRRDRISNIEELCVFGHFHLYFDRQTWTSTHKTQPHTNCGKHLTHSTLFLKGAPHTHTHTQAGTCKNVDTHRTNMQFVQNGMYVCKTTQEVRRFNEKLHERWKRPRFSCSDANRQPAFPSSHQQAR